MSQDAALPIAKGVAHGQPTCSARHRPGACGCLLLQSRRHAHHHLAHMPGLAHLPQRGRHRAQVVRDVGQRAQLQGRWWLC